MRKLLFMAVLLSCGLSFAQDAPSVEVFGGYSHAVIDGSVPLNGWNASLAGNYNRWLGIKADFAGQYGSAWGIRSSTHEFLFGPVVSYRGEKITPFAQALAGVMREAAGGESSNAFAAMVGGGLDCNLSDHWALRLAEVDYLLSRFGSETQNNLRYSTGIVFKFGKR